MRLDLDIDTLVLEGVAGVDRERLAESVRVELGRLLGSSEAVVSSGHESALARQIAQRVHGELSGRISGGFDGGER